MTFIDEIRSLIIPSGMNPNYGDPFVYQDLVNKYGKEKVDKAIEEESKKEC